MSATTVTVDRDALWSVCYDAMFAIADSASIWHGPVQAAAHWWQAVQALGDVSATHLTQHLHAAVGRATARNQWMLP